MMGRLSYVLRKVILMGAGECLIQMVKKFISICCRFSNKTFAELLTSNSASMETASIPALDMPVMMAAQQSQFGGFASSSAVDRQLQDDPSCAHEQSDLRVALVAQLRLMARLVV